jgi:hypothetical protein
MAVIFKSRSLADIVFPSVYSDLQTLQDGGVNHIDTSRSLTVDGMYALNGMGTTIKVDILFSGVDSLIASFLGSSVVNQTETALASNLLGIVNAVQTTPAIYVPDVFPNETQLQNSVESAVQIPQGMLYIYRSRCKW